MNNDLYPIFLRPSRIEFLLVGAGFVGLEKLSFLLKSSPNASVTAVSETFSEHFIDLAKAHNVRCIEASYNASFLQGKSIVIAATNFAEVNRQIYIDAKCANILANVADTPELCDFYLGSIITKGSLKVAISTNGKSPTTAKRLREFFEDVLPDKTDDLIENLNIYRKSIKGNLQDRVEELNRITKKLVTHDKN